LVRPTKQVVATLQTTTGGAAAFGVAPVCVVGAVTGACTAPLAATARRAVDGVLCPAEAALAGAAISASMRALGLVCPAVDCAPVA